MQTLKQYLVAALAYFHILRVQWPIWFSQYRLFLLCTILLVAVTLTSLGHSAPDPWP